ncbi:hypothetical protein Gotur_002755, partial [Gossypium turneri]
MSSPPSSLIENYLREASFWHKVYHHFRGRAVTIGIGGGWVRTHWLQDIFPEPGNDSIEIERIRYDRTYIIEIIGGYLMSELSRNLIHLRWLLKLIDFRAASELSWGSTVLATLYREMCGVTPPNNAKIEGCLSLLQSWARFRFLFLRPRVNHPYTFPLITSYVGIPTTLEDIRLLLDQRSETHDLIIRAVISNEFFKIRTFGMLRSYWST